LISEILPWTAGTDANAATIRSFNGSLATWCAANGATLVLCHDTMGMIRASTGEIDDLNTAYDYDGVHLTATGVVKMAQIIKGYL
jgi:lysophospholipase L1-like esterase